ncbi:hypothetical protein [Piscirickettsia salmonis]|uniref:hypothetical protein n=1 Tax=Piscirickettsia salmonis TaxID=1238 RepID=UPI001E47F1EF|nr:hypothetical protein [Piscirickettsia salmonis]
MLGDFASLDVQNTYRGSDAYAKGTDFNEVSDKEIAKIEHTLNTRRRASLNYRSPNHVFLEYLMAA